MIALRRLNLRPIKLICAINSRVYSEGEGERERKSRHSIVTDKMKSKQMCRQSQPASIIIHQSGARLADRERGREMRRKMGERDDSICGPFAALNHARVARINSLLNTLFAGDPALTDVADNCVATLEISVCPPPKRLTSSSPPLANAWA